jgi:DNA-binding winged helix-turn-helix (wHTH) protein
VNSVLEMWEGLAEGFRLDDAWIDPVHGTVWRDDHRFQLSPLAMEFLLCLAESPGDVIEAGSVAARLGLVSTRPLDDCLEELRGALGDTSDESHYVRSVGRYGYQLTATVHVDVPPVPTTEQILH